MIEARKGAIRLTDTTDNGIATANVITNSERRRIENDLGFIIRFTSEATNRP